MNCQELVELVTAYLDGELSEPDRVAFDEHLSRCEGCARYLEQFEQSIRLLGELPVATLREPVRRRLLDAFADWHPPSE